MTIYPEKIYNFVPDKMTYILTYYQYRVSVNPTLLFIMAYNHIVV